MNAEHHLKSREEPAPTAREVEPGEDRSPALSSESLLRGQKAVSISHNGSVYRLQATRQGKLILTK